MWEILFLSYSNLSLQTACDKNGKKIGKIVSIHATTDQITVAKRSLFSRTITIVFSQSDVLKHDKKKLWLNVDKAEFNLFVKQKQAQINQMLKSAKFAEASGMTKAISYAFTWGKV